LEQLDVLGKTLKKIEALGMVYYITGSIASNFYGLPRLTHDVDIVVRFSRECIEETIAAFREEFYISEEGIREALSGSGMFNIIDLKTGLKIDFWIWQGDDFGESCFERSKRVPIAGDLSGQIASMEDVILHKLYWNRLTPSARQWRDALGIVAVQRELLDYDYLKKWAGPLAIEKDLERLLNDETLPNET
jgi:hypothetical protein